MKIALETTPEQIANLLISAFEGGSNYWYMIESQKKPTKFELYCGKPEADLKKADGSPMIFPHVDYPMNPGGSLTISSLEEPEKGKFTLDQAAIQRGVKAFAASKTYRHHLLDVLNEDTDATTGDVFLQFCLFGDCIYG